MFLRYILRLSLPFLLYFFLVIPYAAMAGEPTNRIKTALDKLIEIVTNHELEAAGMEEKRNKMIRGVVDGIFDWEAFSQRALGRHWRNRSSEEKKEFIYLFGQLLERTYMDKTRQYAGEKVSFVGETIEGNYGVVKSLITTKDGAEIPADYRVRKRGNTWYVYDVQVEGVSLVNNYRTQFNDIIMKSSYEELVKRLKAKLEEG